MLLGKAAQIGVSSPLGAGGEEFGGLAHVGFVVSLFPRCIFLLLLKGGGRGGRGR